MDIDTEAPASNLATQIVTPGSAITSDSAYMRGHGTFGEHGTIYSSVAGVVERINKLVSVRSLKQRYGGEIGDIVVGRITEVASKRWRVDVNSRQDGMLLLSSINLPGGIQRRKSDSDELQMRSFFAEGDLVFAEVQSYFADGALSLHTRSIQYGKLRNGTFVSVFPQLVPRSRTHFHTLPCGVDVVLGVNGYIWVSKHVPVARVEANAEHIYSDENESISDDERESIARVANCIGLLNRLYVKITDTSIIFAFEASLPYPVKDLLSIDVATELAHNVTSRLKLQA
ncbi:Exosome complex component rrp4 [Coemansia sp. RSA 1822]|nr:Exosome complex component rrp4 [Coemansia sp. RSA 638]KAJ2125055.1 Exosome complex component rrp4 [Coemansia sp. RSA 720]KAJ2483494.1 Exosome complex component rrp4 [Coemansia sp. RSA 2131]KAJ2543450.1 Exosome complex component rrp4 [Coemansia sp. RSA 1853]KAJ2561966.1 Exosome complex component rrp4 [Coemansia sp. RSA 1822]